MIVHKHLGQVGDFTLHQCLLKLDARGGNGYGQVLSVGHTVIMLGDNGCHQIRKGFTSSDLRFTEGDLLFGKADKHLLSEANLFFSDGVSVIGKHHSEDRVNDFEGIACKAVEVSHISGVLHGVENVRDQPSVGYLGIKVAGLPGNNARGKTGGHVDCDVIYLMAQTCVVDDKSVFKSKIVGAAFVGFTCVLVGFKSFLVAISNFKHFSNLLVSVSDFELFERQNGMQEHRCSCTVVPSLKHK